MIIKQLTTMETRQFRAQMVKRMVDASVAVQNIIVDAAKGAGRLSEDQVNRICKLIGDVSDEYDMDTLGMIREMVEGDVNLTKGSGSAAAAFDPIDAVDAYAEQLNDQDFDRLMKYAESVRVAYWNF